MRRKRKRAQHPLPLQIPLRLTSYQRHYQRREPQSSWAGIRWYTHPDQWWLPGIPPANQGLEIKGKILPTLPDDACVVSSHPTEGPLLTWILLTSMGIGTHVAAHSAVRLCRDDSLFADAGTCGGGSTCWHHVHQTSDDPWDLQHKFQPYCEGWDYGHDLNGHHHNLHWEGDH